MIDRVKERAVAQLSTQKDRATEGLGSVTDFVRQGTRQLRDQQHDTLAGYVEQAADQIDRFSQQLRNKDVSELVADAQRLARRNPAVFIGSAFALGVVGARFFKSSSQSDDRGHARSSYAGDVYGSRVTGGRYPSAASYGSGLPSTPGSHYSSESNVGGTGTSVSTGGTADTAAWTPASSPKEEWSGNAASRSTGSSSQGRPTPNERS